MVRPGHCPGRNGSPASSVQQGVLSESRHWVETGAGLFTVLLGANPGERGRWDQQREKPNKVVVSLKVSITMEKLGVCKNLENILFYFLFLNNKNIYT